MNPTISSVKPVIFISIQNFFDASTRNRIVSLFNHSEQWQQPWKIIEDFKKADFIMIACKKAEDLSRWHHSDEPISRHQLISFSPIAFPDEARWHLQQPVKGERLPIIKFVMLLKEINQFWKVSKSQQPALSPPLSTTPRPKFDHNWRTKAKVLFVGSVGAGKTTAISIISDGKFINTEVVPTDEVRKRKATTTVALDYGSMLLEDNIKLEIYGTPGQRRFDFMSDILIKQCMGIIILITNDAPNPLAELAYYLEFHKYFLRNNKCVIGMLFLLKSFLSILVIHSGNQNNGLNVNVVLSGLCLRLKKKKLGVGRLCLNAKTLIADNYFYYLISCVVNTFVLIAVIRILECSLC